MIVGKKAGICPKCGSDLIEEGVVYCLCDKDFCMGQRCGANGLHQYDICSNPKCDYKVVPPETQSYYDRYKD